MKSELTEILKQNGKTEEEIGEILSSYNLEELKETYTSLFRVEIWDKKSSINGISANLLLQRKDVEQANEIYLIINNETNKVMFFQTNNPFENGFKPMTKEMAEEVGRKHLSNIVKEHVIEHVLSKVL